MPTPSDDTVAPSSPPTVTSAHSTCPPEHDVLDEWDEHDGPSPLSGEMDQGEEEILMMAESPLSAQSYATQAPITQNNLELLEEDSSSSSTIGASSSRSTTMEPDAKVEDQYSYEMPKDLGFALTPESSLRFSEFSSIRLRQTYFSSFFRAGSKFTGTQQSDKQVYNVEVDIKHIDIKQSFLCGYLKIDGLTKDYPSLTTYFEGEIIGTRYSFVTKHEDWGANERTDMQHWDRFPAWRPLARQAKRADFNCKNWASRENIFMRWKEHFLVPDHSVREINGASFEGFYYICFNQVSGTITGIYFHAKSEKYQQLELKHVSDFGCLGGFEFR